MIGKAGLNEEDGKKVSEWLIDAGKEARANLTAQIEDILAKGQILMPCSNLVSKLEKRIADLEAEVEKLKG